MLVDIELDSDIHPHDPEVQINLLIVDDEEEVLNSLKRLFRNKPFHLKTANSAASGIDFIKSTKPDVIISDMRMPEMMGDEFLAKIYEIDADIPCIVLSGYAEPESILKVVNNANIYQYINKPWNDNELKLSVKNAANTLFLKRSLEIKNRQLFEINRRLEERVKERTLSLIKTNETLQQTITELDQSYNNSVNMLAYFADHRIPELQGHSGLVAKHAERFSQFLGLPKSDIKHIVSAALLHDIGLLSLPEELIKMSCKVLSKENELKMQEHTIIGEAVLAGMPILQTTASYVRSHHEYFDGTGYPDGLNGSDIPLGAQIILLTNDYNSLIGNYCNENPMTQEQVHKTMQEYSGSKYDPELLASLIKMHQSPQDSEDEHEGDLVRAFHSNELEPGMSLYQSLKTKSGMMLLNKDHVLTEKAIKSIQVMEKTEQVHYTIYIYTKSVEESL